MPQLEIILTDNGQTAAQVADGATGTGRARAMAPSAPEGQSGGTGGRDRAERGGTGGYTSILSSLTSFARVLGYGGLVTTVTSVSRAMWNLWQAITSATAAENKRTGDRSADSSSSQGGGQRTGSQTNNTAGQQPTAPGKGTTGPTPGTPTGPKTTSGPAPTPWGTMPQLPSAGMGKMGAPSTLPTAATKPIPVAPAAPVGTAVAPAAEAAATTAAPAAASTAAASGGSAASAAGGASSMMAAAGPIAAVAAAAVVAAVAIKKFTDVAHGEAKRLEGMSPALAQASAMREIRETFADLRRANKVGPQLARFENDRSRMMEALSDVGTNVLKVMLDLYELVRPAVNDLIKGIGVANAQAEALYEEVTGFFEWVWGGEWEDNAKRSKEALQRIVKIMADQGENDGERDPFADMLFGGANRRARAAGRLPAGVANLGG